MAPLAGCSTVPRQEDVTGETTPRIVQKIRCEARDALDRMTIDLLRDPNFDANPTTLDFADRIEHRLMRGTALADPGNFKRLPKRQQKIFEQFTLSAVTFDFKFFIEEENLNSASSIFAYPILSGAFNLGPGVEGNFGRETEKRFQVTNTFFVLHDIDPNRCDVVTARAENAIYPITGKIGVEKIFREFIDIDEMRSKYTETTTYTDRLTFATEYKAGVTPALTLSPVLTNRFELSSATSTFSARRKDTHEVTFSIAKGEPANGRNILLEFDLARQQAARISIQNADAARLQNLIIVRRDLLAARLR
ncbi:hypothetical protein [Methylobacterium sp. Leaf456]|uniref:hypothetical protein n=1 Tax=Methylobacterium sp. Leaf456 TaxID=1736382 RepID=UPI0012E36CDA|nr:hypothetical protein [Methylobacterium sp. Leaf456]